MTAEFKNLKNIKYIIFLLASTILFLISCEEEEKPPILCGIENPQDNIEWLSNYLQYRSCIEVYVVVYQGQEYIGLVDCGNTPHPSSSYYNCVGEYYCGYDSYDGTWSCNEDFTEAINDRKLIFKHVND